MTRWLHNNPAKTGMVKDLGKLVRFKQFNREKDEHEYLDTKEKIDRNREDLAQIIIAEYRSEKGIVSGRQIESRPKRLQEIVVALLSRTKHSHRKVAGLLNIDVNVVHRESGS